MARHPNESDEGLQKALTVIQTTSDAEALRAAQAVLLPMRGHSLDVTAEVIGRDRYWVSRARNRFLRGQVPQTHGGRRNALLSEDEEVALVKRAIVEGDRPMEFSDESTRAVLRRLLDERGGGSETAVTDMLNRVAGKLVKGARWGHIAHLAYAMARIYSVEEALAKVRPAGS